MPTECIKTLCSISLDTIAALLTAVGTLTLAGIALFYDKLRAWRRRPILEIAFDLEPPHCNKTTIMYPMTNSTLTFPLSGGNLTNQPSPLLSSVDGYYFRLRIRNIGKSPAEQVEVFASELLYRTANGKFERVASFLPINLLWTHIKKPYRDAISPGMEKHCDLGHIIDPSNRSSIASEDNTALGVSYTETLFSFDVEVLSYTKSYLIKPGYYQLKLIIAASNSKPIPKTLGINHTGKWFTDEKRMLSEGIGITVL